MAPKKAASKAKAKAKAKAKTVLKKPSKAPKSLVQTQEAEEEEDPGQNGEAEDEEEPAADEEAAEDEEPQHEEASQRKRAAETTEADGPEQKARRQQEALEETKRQIAALLAAKGKGKGSDPKKTAPKAGAKAAAKAKAMPGGAEQQVASASKAEAKAAAGRSPRKGAKAAERTGSSEPASTPQESPKKGGGEKPDEEDPGDAPAEPSVKEPEEAPKEKKAVPKPKAKSRRGPPPTAAAPEVLSMLSRIADFDKLQRAAYDAGYNAIAVPLSKVSKEMVREGFTWLKAIEREMAKKEPKPETLEALSQSFYEVVPLLDSEEKDAITTKDLFQRRLRVVSMLSDIEAGHPQWRVLLAEDPASQGAVSGPSTDTLQLLYKSLKCELRAEPSGSATWQLVEKYLASSFTSAQPPKVRGIFSISRPQDAPKYQRFATNPTRLLLWQGAPLTSWLSLLAAGPRLPPKEAPESGYAFGKGLYFFNAARAAMAAGTPFVLLLAEVALGSSRQLHEPEKGANKLPQGFLSIHAPGAFRPDRSVEHRFADGTTATVPIGPLHEVSGPSWGKYDEFVVFNAAQIRMRYLVEVENAVES